VSPKRGFTTAVQLETSVNQAMIENSSDRVVVAADHSKMNCVSSFLTCALNRVDLLVTDWMTPLAFCEELQASGLNVFRVPEDQ
jgi:DeoR/GlpR family transcriptional regulator of sugar metabolism